MAEVQAVDPKAPETTTEDELDESLSASLTDEGEQKPGEEDDDAEEVKGFDPEKFQKQNRELGNLKRENETTKRELAELKELLKKQGEKPAETKAQQEDRDEADDLIEDLAALQRDGFTDEERAKKVFGKLGAQLKKAKRSSEIDEIKQQLQTLQEAVKSTTTVSRQSAVWDQNYPDLEGQYAKFNAKALKLAKEDLGEDADSQQILGAATSLMQRMAKMAVKAKKSGASGTTDKDKTAMTKPATPTKGTANVKRGAAPSADLSELSDDDLRRIMAQHLEEGEAE